MMIGEDLHYVAIPRVIAKQRGVKRYYDGRVCKQNHIVAKWTSDTRCYLCAKERVRNRDENRYAERRKAYNRRDEVKVRAAEWKREDRKKKPEKYTKYEKTKQSKIKQDPIKREKERIRRSDKQKRRYRANPERFISYAKQRRENPAIQEAGRKRSEQYRKENPEVIRNLNLKWNHIDRAARKKRLPKWLTDEDRKNMYELYKVARELGMHVDHIIPLQGKRVSGLHVPSNLQLLTPSENLAKKNKYEIA